MNYRLLGRTGVRVSPLCMGTMTFGDSADEAESAKMFARCREVGINFFDCANGYAGGRSEIILGKLIADCRDEVVITSKSGFPQSDGVNDKGSSRRHLQLQVEKSLKRLNTDRIDVYFIHRFDPDTPIEAVVRTLDDLVQQGKILYPAISNWAAWQIMKALGVAAYQGLARAEVLQPMYSLVKRQAEVEILPLAQAEGLGVIPYSPLGGGLLTGKYTTTQKAEDGRLVQNKMYSIRYGDTYNYQVAEAFTQYAADKGYTPATLAVAWVMSNPAVTAAIVGARSVAQLESSLAALDVPMTPEWRAEISTLSATPPPATDRSEEAK
ncbi:MAG: aldo/keto reductase [Chloroflexi bacterium]|nr:aldo/keto reductase [Chloroflexota bacterium]